MKIQEFVKACLRTESIPDDVVACDCKVVQKYRLAHAAVGLVTEMDELRLTYGVNNSEDGLIASIEELSDAEWYCALAIDALRIEAPETQEFSDVARIGFFLFQEVCEFADLTKKHVFYGRDNFSDLKKCLLLIILAIGNLRHQTVAKLMYHKAGFVTFDQSQAACRAGLLAKLARRYPQKFSDVVQRDGASEMDAFLKATGLFQT